MWTMEYCWLVATSVGIVALVVTYSLDLPSRYLGTSVGARTAYGGNVRRGWQSIKMGRDKNASISTQMRASRVRT